MSACPLCGSTTERIIERRGAPVFQNLPLATRQLALDVVRGDFDLCVCPRCGFVFNAAFDERRVAYGEGYDNDQSCSPRFEAHTRERVDAIVSHGVRSKRVLEIGAGRGAFLVALAERGGNRGIGFDPAYRGPPAIADGVEMVATAYAPHRAVDADAIVCRHVIVHVGQPLDLLRYAASGARSGTLAFFETPDVDWILRGKVAHDFFYEHCSYFSASSLAFAFARAGFRDVRVSSVFGDQYLWLESVVAPERDAPPSEHGARVTLELARAFRASDAPRIAARIARLRAMSASGRVAVWGAGAKGVTFLCLVDPDGALVTAAVDVNPRKQGLFVPGSGHPIVAPRALEGLGVTDVIVMNANYMNEIVTQVGGKMRVHDEATL